jgi:hypothetical protein
VLSNGFTTATVQPAAEALVCATLPRTSAAEVLRVPPCRDSPPRPPTRAHAPGGKRDQFGFGRRDQPPLEPCAGTAQRSSVEPGSPKTVRCSADHALAVKASGRGVVNLPGAQDSLPHDLRRGSPAGAGSSAGPMRGRRQPSLYEFTILGAVARGRPRRHRTSSGAGHRTGHHGPNSGGVFLKGVLRQRTSAGDGIPPPCRRSANRVRRRRPWSVPPPYRPVGLPYLDASAPGGAPAGGRPPSGRRVADDPRPCG